MQQDKQHPQLSEMACCPGSAGDIPAKRGKLAAATLDLRPSSAPSHLESVSQVRTDVECLSWVMRVLTVSRICICCLRQASQRQAQARAHHVHPHR